MKSWLLFFFLSLNVYLFAQTPSKVIKPAIDSSAISNWADLLDTEPIISSDGHYFLYVIDNLPVGNKTLVIQKTQGDWKKEFVGAECGIFSSDGRKVIFKKKDSLNILDLRKQDLLVVDSLLSYKCSGKWIAYQLNTADKDVVLYSLTSSKIEKRFSNINNYHFDRNGKTLLLSCSSLIEGHDCSEIIWFDTNTEKLYNVWASQSGKKQQPKAEKFQFDEKGKQLTFLVETLEHGNISNSIWYYRNGMERAILKADDDHFGIDSNMLISNDGAYFSKNGDFIFFKIRPKLTSKPKPIPNAARVDVWSIKDMVLQYTQLLNLKFNRSAFIPKNKFIVSIPVAGNKINRIEKNNETINCGLTGDHGYMVVSYQQYTGDKSWITPEVRSYLVSLSDGSRKFISNGLCKFYFYPEGGVIVYYDYQRKAYFSYFLKTGQAINISQSIPVRLTDENMDECTRNNYYPNGIAGWVKGQKVMIYDNYDIWIVDLLGKEAPVNMTNGYGIANNIKFKIVANSNSDEEIYDTKRPIFLTAYNISTRFNGFFRIKPGGKMKLEQLTFGPYNYFTCGTQAPGLHNMKPVKASLAAAWIVKRQTASEAPNFYFSKDFRHFKQLTNIQPQVKYNWFFTELLTWKLPDGINCQGILYVPENIDTGKKYPVIINFYEKRSQYLHQFLRPGFSNGDINIPWFVSQGYLVFTPDIHYIIGKTGESVVNSVISGARELFKLPYIDSTKIAIQGHGFGGYETNYLITHSNIFAAAAESAGITNWISSYASLLPYESSTVTSQYEEGGQLRVGATLWENREAYIENSPIIYVHRITTPLLMMHNKNDNKVSWMQGIEFYTGLRRNAKKAWMLQYDRGTHEVNGKEAIDYSIRLTQFFDHYLKSTLPPKWMTVGIPAKLKGVTIGLELDSSGKCGKDCPVCNK